MSLAHPIYRRRDVFVGYTADNKRVHIDAELRTDDGERQTIEHETVQSPVTLSATHSTYKGKKNIDRNVESMGRGYRDVLRVVRPAPGYTLAEVHELGRIGERWHLNTMQAGCAHMDVPKGKSGSELLDMGIVCPETGYKWGSAWLTEELPQEVADRFKELADKGEVHPHED